MILFLNSQCGANTEPIDRCWVYVGTMSANIELTEVRPMTGCIFIAACPFCSQAEGQWYSHWGNTLSCSNVRSPADINCASTLAEVL